MRLASGLISTGRGRLIFHESGAAAWNMAVDQSILESVSQSQEAGEHPTPVLRFYTWQTPTLSLGYFQPRDGSSPRFDSLDRVRRSTGGGAILHHHDLTYSLIVPTGPGERGAQSELYQSVHSAIVVELDRESIAAQPFRLTGSKLHDLNKSHLSSADPFLCFQRRTDEDLIVSGYKVLGSAQRRSKRALLQHGSLLLAASEYARELPGIYDLTSQSLDPQRFAKRIAASIGELIGYTFKSSELTVSEQDRANQISANRFESTAWWARR